MPNIGFSEVYVNNDVLIKIHSNHRADTIIVSYPGYNGGIDGFGSKYEKIARLLVRKGVGTVIRMENKDRPGIPYEQSLIADLRAVIEFAIEKAPAICATANPAIFLMGFSAGASAMASVAAEYPSIKKMLLVAPSGDAGQKNLSQLVRFQGSLYITVGSQDEIVGSEAGNAFAAMAASASEVHLVIVPNCGHQFRGKKNGMILSKAPLWAFAGESTYPSPDGGIVLY